MATRITRSMSHRSQETLLLTLRVDNEVSILGAANVESLRLIAPAQSKCCLLHDDIYIIDTGLCAVNESRYMGRTRTVTNAAQLREPVIFPA